MKENIAIWITSVIGITFLGCFLKIIAPEGKTAKAASFVISLIIAFSIISPLSSLIKSTSDYNGIAMSDEAINENINQRINEMNAGFAEKYFFNAIKSELKRNKVSIGMADIVCGEKDGSYFIKKISIDKNDLEYSGDEANIDISSLVTDIISKKYSIDKKDIVVYE